MSAYTCTDLLQQIKLDAFIPEGQNTFEDEDILRIASTVLETEILPLILSTKGDYYLTSEVLTVDQNGFVRIPSRAIGNAVAEVRNEDGCPIVEVEPRNQKLFIPSFKGKPVEVFYYLRPGKLTDVYATVVNIDFITKTVTLNSTPSVFNTSLRYDFVKPFGGCDTYAIDKTCLSLDPISNQMVFTLSLPSELQVGDYLVVADTSPVPQIPVEIFGYLSHLTAIKMLKSLGDNDAAGALQSDTEDKRKAALSLICPRVSKHSKTIVRPY